MVRLTRKQLLRRLKLCSAMVIGLITVVELTACGDGGGASELASTRTEWNRVVGTVDVADAIKDLRTPEAAPAAAGLYMEAVKLLKDAGVANSLHVWEELDARARNEILAEVPEEVFDLAERAGQLKHAGWLVDRQYFVEQLAQEFQLTIGKDKSFGLMVMPLIDVLLLEATVQRDRGQAANAWDSVGDAIAVARHVAELPDVTSVAIAFNMLKNIREHVAPWSGSQTEVPTSSRRGLRWTDLSMKARKGLAFRGSLLLELHDQRQLDDLFANKEEIFGDQSVTMNLTTILAVYTTTIAHWEKPRAGFDALNGRFGSEDLTTFEGMALAEGGSLLRMKLAIDQWNREND